MADAPDLSGKKTIGRPPRDIPALPQDSKTIDPAVRAPLEQMRASVQELLGFRGDPLDQALTYRTARDLGIVNSLGQYSVDGAVGTPIGGTGPGGGTVIVADPPDLTSPPSVTGLAATAGLANIIVTWNAPVYTVGHGHQATNLYAVKKAANDPTLPTFANAQLYAQETGALTIAALPSDLAIRWHLWAKFLTVDGVESPSPAGGTNGVTAQTGLIGGVDLGPQIVEARNLAVASPSIIADQVLELFTGGRLQWLASTNVAVPTGAPFAYAGQYQSRDNIFGPKVPVSAGEQYRVSIWVNRTGLGAIAAGVVVYPFNAAGAVVGTAFVGTTPTTVGTVWEQASINLSVPAGAVFLQVGPWLNQAFGATGKAWFTGLLVQRRIDATLVTTNMIVAGSGAIGNLAVDNAAIAALAVDDAKIASLSAAKLTVGDGTIGGNLKSSNYVGNTAGWIVRPDGTAEFGFAHIRGTLVANQIGANYISSTMINAGQITAGKIGANAVTAGNLAAGAVTVGNVSDAINGGISTGARISVTANRIAVYDANVLRVKLGDLS